MMVMVCLVWILGFMVCWRCFLLMVRVLFVGGMLVI